MVQITCFRLGDAGRGINPKDSLDTDPIPRAKSLLLSDTITAITILHMESTEGTVDNINWNKNHLVPLITGNSFI